MPADVTLAELHNVIQAVMGWADYHLHEFDVGGARYGPEDDEKDLFGVQVEDETCVTLEMVARRVGVKLGYHYDFGDDWVHRLSVQKIEPAEPGQSYPLSLPGKRAAPPEDSGGPHFYEDFLEALRDPSHPDHEEKVDWVGDFDPEYFNLEEVQRAPFPTAQTPATSKGSLRGLGDGGGRRGGGDFA